MIDITCPSCKERLELSDDLQGEEIECPSCEHSFGVPYQPEIMEDKGDYYEDNVSVTIPKKKRVSTPQRSRNRNRMRSQTVNPHNPVMTTDKSESNIHIACWIIWVITFLLIAVPYFPTFWLWIPLWIAGLICTIIAFVKARYITGIIGIMWSLMGTPLWWFVSGLITVAVFGAAGAARGDSDEEEPNAILNPFDNLDKAREKARNEAEKVEANALNNYIPKIEVIAFKTQYIKTFGNDKVAACQLRLKNKGTKTIKSLTITIYFLDASGATIYEDTMYPVNTSSFSGGQTLKPGYLTSMGDKWSTFEKCPPEWKEGSVKYKITDIDFEE